MPLAVTVLGDAVLDVHVVPSTPMRANGDVPAAVTLLPGGQGANIAVRLARRGVPVTLVCALAADAAGVVLRDALSGEGVTIDAVNATTTGSVVVLLDARGGRTMLSQRVPLLGQIDARSFGSGDGWVVVSGYVLLEPRSAKLATVIAQSPTVVVGCSLQAADVTRWRTSAQALRPRIVVLNGDEATALAPHGTHPGDLGRELAESFDALTVVTDAQGASASCGDVSVRVDARSDRPAVDTTGAGDAFAATMLAMLLDVVWPPTAEVLTDAMAAAIDLAGRVAAAPGAQARVAGELATAPRP